MDRANQRGTVSEGDVFCPRKYIPLNTSYMMANPSGERTPINPDRFIQSLQNAETHSPYGLEQISARFETSGRPSQQSESSRSQRASFVRGAG